MLSENKTVRQRYGDGYRRWFLDDYFDLIIWYDDSKRNLIGFQLCYEKLQNERAVTYKIENDRIIRSHRYITSSLAVPPKKDAQMTAILKGDADRLNPEVIEKFLKEFGKLEEDLKLFIVKELNEFL